MQRQLEWRRGAVFYRADDNDFHCQWRPSIHMPKEAARIFLRVIGVRVERLQDITVNGILQEGIDFDIETPIASWRNFIDLWESTLKNLTSINTAGTLIRGCGL